jgi:uncharacterized protein
MQLREGLKPRNTYQDFFSLIYEKSTMCTKTVTLVVTEKCNLKCSYCYEVHKNNRRMTKETARKTIDMLFDEYENDSRYINVENSEALILEFIGGEPLLEIDLIDYTVDYFKHKAINLKHSWALNYMISMTSNGILYNTPKVQRFIKKNENHVSLTITIDGNKELHDACRVFSDGKGSYDIVEKAIKSQVAEFKEVSTKLTLAPENINYLVDAIKNLRALGLSSVFANTVFEEGWNLEHAKVFYSQLKMLADWLIDEEINREFYCSLFEDNIGAPMPESDNKNWCGGTGAMLAIDTTGIIYPCLRYLPFTIQNNREPMVIGDIYKGLENTEKQHSCVDCLKCITRKSQSTDECFNCPIAQGCAWCSAYNYDVFGTPDKRATFICVMHKARVLANAYYWNKMYKAQGDGKKFTLHVPKEWAVPIIGEEEYEMLKKMSEI